MARFAGLAKLSILNAIKNEPPIGRGKKSMRVIARFMWGVCGEVQAALVTIDAL